MFVYGTVAGMCQPRVAGTVGAEPFSAKLRYTGTEDTEHPNLIKLTVTMPHIDGKRRLNVLEEVTFIYWVSFTKGNLIDTREICFMFFNIFPMACGS